MPKESISVAPEAAPVRPALVTIVASQAVTVVIESIADRERHENGRHPLEAQSTGHYVVHEGQSLRILNG